MTAQQYEPDAALLACVRSGAWLDAQVFPPVQFAVPGFIPEGYTVLVGPPKAGKSWLILDTCLAVAAGGMALGGLPVPDSGKVLYLALEDGDRRLQGRIRVLLGSEPIPAAFHYATRVDRARVLDTIHAWMDAHPDTRLIVLDTLGKVMPPAIAGESAYERDYRVGGHLKAVTDRYPGLALVVIHHDRKTRSDDFVDSVSGTNGIAGAADTIVALQRDRHSDNGVVSITGRDVRESDFALTMHGGTSWRLTGDSLTEARQAAHAIRQEVRAGGMGDQMREVLAVVRKAGDGVRAKDVAAATGLAEKVAGVYLNRAAEAGLIDRLSRGLYGPLPYVPSEEVLEVLEAGGVSNTPNTSTGNTGGVRRSNGRESQAAIDDPDPDAGADFWPAGQRAPYSDSWATP